MRENKMFAHLVVLQQLRRDGKDLICSSRTKTYVKFLYVHNATLSDQNVKKEELGIRAGLKYIAVNSTVKD